AERDRTLDSENMHFVRNVVQFPHCRDLLWALTFNHPLNGGPPVHWRFAIPDSASHQVGKLLEHVGPFMLPLCSNLYLNRDAVRIYDHMNRTVTLTRLRASIHDLRLPRPVGEHLSDTTYSLILVGPLAVDDDSHASKVLHA